MTTPAASVATSALTVAARASAAWIASKTPTAALRRRAACLASARSAPRARTAARAIPAFRRPISARSNARLPPTAATLTRSATRPRAHALVVAQARLCRSVTAIPACSVSTMATARMRQRRIVTTSTSAWRSSALAPQGRALATGLIAQATRCQPQSLGRRLRCSKPSTRRAAKRAREP